MRFNLIASRLSTNVYSHFSRSFRCVIRNTKAVALTLGILVACQPGTPHAHAANPRHQVQLTPQLLATMREKGMRKESPILIRTYKQEGELEVWKKNRSGHYALLKVFPICRWSGQLGPKHWEGDGQAPEGYYAITPVQMNPNSNYHLAFNTGYPNAYDRARGSTGSYLMVHGNCASIGCYAMSDQGIEEIYALVREAHSAGQKAVQMQAFPFRFTPQNMARHRLNPNMPFWENLKEGADRFDIAKEEPRVDVCNGRYTFDRVAGAETCGDEANPALARKVAERRRADNAKVAALVTQGIPAVAFAYDNGGQNSYFRDKLSPEWVIATGPVIRLLDARGLPTFFAARAAGGDEASIAAAVTDVSSRVVAMNEAANNRKVETTQAPPTSPTFASEKAMVSLDSTPNNDAATPPVVFPSESNKARSIRHEPSAIIALVAVLTLGFAATLTRILRRRRTAKQV